MRLFRYLLLPYLRNTSQIISRRASVGHLVATKSPCLGSRRFLRRGFVPPRPTNSGYKRFSRFFGTAGAQTTLLVGRLSHFFGNRSRNNWSKVHSIEIGPDFVGRQPTVRCCLCVKSHRENHQENKMADVSTEVVVENWPGPVRIRAASDTVSQDHLHH